MKCRHCQADLHHTFLDLGFAPPSNSYIKREDLQKPEHYFPLRVKICTNCWLAQTEDYASAGEIFTKEYAYFSSTSSSWQNHAKKYVDLVEQKLQLDSNSFVIEIASNDGYLLKHFLEKKIPCLGVEPTQSTALAAEKLGIKTIRKFFGQQLASELPEADLIIGNNVYAHVPDINDFTMGLKTALKKGGTITLEFPHLLQLLKNKQFDTIYHEHYSYLSLYSVQKIFSSCGLLIYDVEKLSTHGGSLRIYGGHVEDSFPINKKVHAILDSENEQRMKELATYKKLGIEANDIKNQLLQFLLDKVKTGKKVVAYGAAAKGSTLLNFAGIKSDLLPCIFDKALSKQGKYMPGSHIPIRNPDDLEKERPDYIIILPWNIKNEVMEHLKYAKNWGAKFVTCIPKLEVL